MPNAMPPFTDPAVEQAFASFPDSERAGLLTLRALIFETAASLPEVGALEETLKWGQPAYLTPQTKSGSTIRLGVPKQGGFAIFAHCQSTIIPDFQHIFPDDFRYEGTQAVCFDDSNTVALDKLRVLIQSALTYHLK